MLKLPLLKLLLVRTVQFARGSDRLVEVSRWNVPADPMLFVPLMMMLRPLIVMLLMVGGTDGAGAEVIFRSMVALAWSSTSVAVTPAGNVPRTRFGNGSAPT